MKVVFISNLFPDAKNPQLGIYNANLLKHLSKLCDIRVLAPRPTKGFPPLWFPKQLTSRKEDAVFQPVFAPAAYVPKIGSRFNHLLMARSIEPALRKIRKEFPFDVVLSSWIYPDACATAQLAGRNGFPFVAIAQGSDVHQYLKIPARRKIISEALGHAAAVVARSKNLSHQLQKAGVDKGNLHVIYNGVDLAEFHPSNASAVRRDLGLPEDATVLLFVGNMLPIKNPLLLVEAHAALCRDQPHKRFILVMIGDGPLIQAAKQRAETLGTGALIQLPGTKASNEVARYMQAANLLCVTSNNEGVPNVILEAFASGLRVVAREVGGIPEVLSQEFLGRLVPKADAQMMAKTIVEVLAVAPDPERIMRCAHQFSWDATAQQYYKILRSAMKTLGI